MKRGPIVVLTALETEHAAVRRRLTDVRSEPHQFGTIFEVGRIPGVASPVILALAGEGNTTVAAITERAISTYTPMAVLFVGVAGALHDELAIGDVVIPTRIYAFHGGREDDDGFQARPRAWEADHRLIQLARYVSRSTDRVRVHFKPIAAGAVLLDGRTSPIARQIRRHYQDAAAIEMESAGLAHAGHLADRCPVMPIRGISDRADGHKAAADRAGSQSEAAQNAADFAVEFMRQLSTVGGGGPSAHAPARVRRRRRYLIGAGVIVALVATVTGIWQVGGKQALTSANARAREPSSQPAVSKPATAATGLSAATSPATGRSDPASRRPSTSAADPGVAAMVGKWSGTLHQPGGDPAYYPMKITLRAGHPPDEIGESWYSKQNCHGTLTLGDANQYGFMLTEDIQEPRGVCSKTPMHFTVRVTRGDELEVKYWWSANINAASIWYADATLQRLR